MFLQIITNYSFRAYNAFCVSWFKILCKKHWKLLSAFALVLWCAAVVNWSSNHSSGCNFFLDSCCIFYNAPNQGSESIALWVLLPLDCPRLECQERSFQFDKMTELAATRGRTGRAVQAENKFKEIQWQLHTIHVYIQIPSILETVPSCCLWDTGGSKASPHSPYLFGV